MIVAPEVPSGRWRAITRSSMANPASAGATFCRSAVHNGLAYVVMIVGSEAVLTAVSRANASETTMPPFSSSALRAD
jgi:hypothetical protein